MTFRGLLVLAFLLTAGCAQLKARSAFSRGEKARAAGDVASAIAAYEEAVAAEDKPEYREALDTTRRDAGTSRVRLAKEAEARGDFAEAVKQYDEAARFLPNDEEIGARRQLAVLRTKQADPVDYYKAAARLAKLLPGDQGAQRALVEAQKEALFYHLRLASVYAGAKSWKKAFAEYEIAKQIQPDHAAFSGASYRRTAAQHYETSGDEAMAKGDALAAFSHYERAAALVSSARLDRKMKRAKRGAGSLLDQLQQAETFERLSKWEDAAEIYSLVAGRPDTPADIKKKATVARAKSAAIRAERAKAYAERNLPAKATGELAAAVDHTDGPIDAVTLARKGIEDLLAERPGAAHANFEKARGIAGDKLAALRVATIVLTSVAKKIYEKAKGGSDAADALVALRRLEPFAASLPGYEKAKKGLRKRAFGALLTRAKEHSNMSRDEAASELLATALEISRPPKKLAEPLARGTKALNERDYATAFAAFTMAKDTDPRSRLAATGYDVARLARLRQLRRDADEAKVVEDAVRASTAYRAILDIDPNDVSARLGLDELRADIVHSALSNAKAHEGAGRLGAAFVYYRRVLSLEPDHAEAKPAATAIAGKLGSGSAGVYVAPAIRGNHLGETCKGIEGVLRDRLKLYLARTKGLGVDVLANEAHDLVDAKKRARPPIVLRTAVESCKVSKAAGTARVTMQLVMGKNVVAQSSVDGAFDPASVPKDELEDGLAPDRVMSDVVGSAAKKVAAAVKAKNEQLSGWRAVEARASLRANDAERVARVYAGLVRKNGSKTSDERAALEEIERFLNSRFR